MNNDEIIDQIIFSFTSYNLRDIREINAFTTDFTIAEFILCSCFIDQISGFRYNITSVGKRYRDFVKEYLPIYDPDELYLDLRNKLVHNYSVGGYYGLTRNSPSNHLKMVNNKKCLNLENFISDLEIALNTYIMELGTNQQIRSNALQWYNTHKIITLLA